MTNKNPLIPPSRTQLVMDTLQGATTPLAFRAAERLANRRLLELEKIVQGLSAKWMANKTDKLMLTQTKEEMGRITQALCAARDQLGVD